MGNKRATAVRKQQEKAALRRKAKEEKLAKRNERTFAKSLANFQESSFEGARAFVDGQLDDNPGWIRPLADLIRDGALQTLLRTTAAGPSESTGPSAGKWVGKAKTFGELPTEAMAFMLEAIGVKVGDGVVRDVLSNFFLVQFFVDESVALPAGSRSFEVLDKIAKDRFKALKEVKVAPVVEKDFDGNCWAIDEDGAVTFALSRDSQKLPALSTGDVWVLDDQHSPAGRVHSQLTPAVAFDCRSLFPEVRDIDPQKKWAVKKDKADKDQ